MFIYGTTQNNWFIADMNNAEALHQRVMGPCETIRHRVEVFEKVRQSKIRRAHAYIEASIGYFEHLLCVAG